ncbi:MAG: DUF4340 domain-containing protein [Treponema sp.]|nr:DUF4340 domain-containing protein [Treponema sp.]
MMKNKINLILLIILIFLFSVFILSFFNNPEKKSKTETVKTTLVSGSLINEIKNFEIKCGEEILDFKCDSFGGTSEPVWFCGYYTETGSFFLPAKQEKIEAFLSELSRPRNLEKISLNKSRAENFGLGEDYAFIIRYLSEMGSSEIRFGDSNFSETGRYLKGESDASVYLTDKSFDSFLFTGLNQWCDPYLVSRNLGTEYKLSDFMNLRNQELVELRHGGISFYEPLENEVPSKILNLEMGDTSSFKITCYKIPSENNYHVNVVYKNPLKSNSKEMEYSVKISEWTYNKL